MNKAAIGKLALSALGMALTLGSTLINDKIKDEKLNETVAKRVEEALKNQAKES